VKLNTKEISSYPLGLSVTSLVSASQPRLKLEFQYIEKGLLTAILYE
jgi:hypothetical protein